MKHLILIALLLFPAAAFAQSNDQLAKAYAACNEHRDTSQKFAHVTRVKAWAPGWEKCSNIQDQYDAAFGTAAKDAADKALVDKLAK